MAAKPTTPKIAKRAPDAPPNAKTNIPKPSIIDTRMASTTTSIIDPLFARFGLALIRSTNDSEKDAWSTFGFAGAEIIMLLVESFPGLGGFEERPTNA
ncbi:hypothetical protein EXU57_09060 [Segetibacter sp. 3557_3]|uniref:hypothetical protein n=1 Tax=Segetibacter sp. 3557_3 TaxID=2547429 RepID=UPI00105913E1|nr:hypothetical protein [Segetibacter sp. 3557_3]TDH26943.1 hypothetical protein EXU57_09060 [Segetibacter sp. 3557_3]